MNERTKKKGASKQGKQQGSKEATEEARKHVRIEITHHHKCYLYYCVDILVRIYTGMSQECSCNMHSLDTLLAGLYIR